MSTPTKSKITVEEKLKRTKVTLDRSLDEHARRGQVAVGIPVEGARGSAPLKGALSFDQLKSGGFIKQRQKDLFTVRCRCPGGRVPSAWLRAVADAADNHGKGYVHLSFRQSLEIPYINVKDFPEVTRRLNEGGARVATCGPRVRVPTACAGCEYNPNGLTDTQEMTRLVDREFFGEEYYHKFKISFSGCPIDCARTNENDLGFQGAAFPVWHEPSCTGCTICAKACGESAITPDADSGAPEFAPGACLYCSDCIRACPTESWQAGLTGWVVRVGGRHGRHPHNGTIVARLIPDAMVVPTIRTVLDW
jgi:dissimilatory sulfite reductase (desulfoviridin) alpha/beta subunit